MRISDWSSDVCSSDLLNCMDRDGVRDGYDIPQLRAVRAACDVPLVASGGAGTPEHFVEAFREADADAALAASVFHSGAIAIPALKQYLGDRAIAVRQGSEESRVGKEGVSTCKS